MTKTRYYTAAETRELDRLAIEKHHIPGFELMQRAGLAAWNELQKRWPGAKNILVFCGNGNNGGDGFIVASLAKRAGLEVEIFLAGDPAKISGDAGKAYQMALAEKLRISPVPHILSFAEQGQEPGQTIIVDALLGTGLSGAVREPYKQLIQAINDSSLPVLAIDIPSGLCSDSGKILGAAIRADLTVTFIGQKLGMTLEQGPACCGDIIFNTLDVPEVIYSEL